MFRILRICAMDKEVYLFVRLNLAAVISIDVFGGMGDGGRGIATSFHAPSVRRYEN